MTHAPRRKLRVMIISMGGERQRVMERIFAEPHMQEQFEPPTFSPGIPSRSIRNRNDFFRVAHEAGLIPDGPEWTALQLAADDPYYKEHADRFFDCLCDIPVVQEGRRGSPQDTSIHYSRELWRKAKALNRGRAVLACLLAHLIGLREFVAQGFDLLLEDNVRLPVKDCARRIWEGIHASEEWCQRDGISCHFRYTGFLGSISNLRWIYQWHISRCGFTRESAEPGRSECTVFPFPTAHDIDQYLADDELESATEFEKNDDRRTGKLSATKDDRKPGGNPVWGCYGYWISKEGYQAVLAVLRSDVGAMLWKGKRNRHYSVKPVDKILPRQIMSLFGTESVHIPTHPTVFRAPMLTSKIHTQWDPEFCKSTDYQLRQSGLCWSDLWLTEAEKAVVNHYEATGEWVSHEALEVEPLGP
jgi:hypothetical protein